jgi:molecular chaperone GrpE (heat shock protein)
MHGLLSNAIVALCVSTAAVVVGCTGLLLAFFARNAAARELKRSTQALHQETQTGLSRVDEEILHAQRTIEEFRQSLTDVRSDADRTARTVRELIKTIADRHVAAIFKAETNGEGEKSALRQVYETAKAERSRFSPALASIAPLISGLSAYQHRGNPEMEGQINGVIKDFRQMMDVDTHLSSTLAELGAARGGSALRCEELARSFESGAIPDAAYLTQVLCIDPVEHHMLADPLAEQSRLKELQLRMADVFLAWLDRVNELRAFSTDRDSGEVATLCTNIIRQSRGVLSQLELEIDDVEIGRTMFDARLHDLVHTVSTARARPETVIGVLRLGYRRNGRVMRKPQVLVATAEG